MTNFGAHSDYAWSDGVTMITCCGKTTYIECYKEPVINDKAIAILECPNCKKIHYVRMVNDSGYKEGPLKLLEVKEID